MVPFHRNFNFILKKGSSKKKSYERRAYESEDERAYLGLCPDKRRKNNLVLKGLKKIKISNYTNPLTPRRTQVSPFTEISILF